MNNGNAIDYVRLRKDINWKRLVRTTLLSISNFALYHYIRRSVVLQKVYAYCMSLIHQSYMD